MREVGVAEGPDYCISLRARVLAKHKYLAISLLVIFGLARPACGVETATPKNVLILYSFTDRSLTPSADSLESALRTRVSGPVNFYVEYLESRRFDDGHYETGLAENLKETYAGMKLDLLITDALPALEFALAHRNELFPGVPIVFLEVEARRIAGQKMWPGVTGVTDIVDVRMTINLVLHLHPRTKAVAVITNDSRFERYWLAVVHAELLPHQSELREIDLVAIPTDQLLDRVAVLPPQTVVLFQEAPQDSIQPAIGAYDALRMIGQRLPTYCIFPIVCLNHGGIGGADFDLEEQVSLAAEQASRVLSGERPENISVAHGTSDVIRVDWRELRRWSIPESALPPGSVALYREPTLWERERKYILAGMVVIFAQLLLIIGLLWQRARKRKAEAVLTESEGRFQRMANTTPSLVWMCDTEGKVTYLNDRRIEFTGRDSGSGYEDVWTKYIHPDDLEAVLSANALGLERRERFSKQYRLRRKDGAYRWMFDVAAPRVNDDGSFAGFIGSAADITDQIVAQEALEKISGQLIEAQEKERSRIARDLHDDICQRLALISMELEQANRDGFPPAAKQHLEKIRQQCSEVAGDIQSLSHQLHSSKLEYLGLVAATRGMCKELAKQHEVSIEFAAHNVPRLPADISLCLFRVAQEALNNAIKYSQSTQFGVELSAAASNVRLEVRDDGAGFDVEEAKRNSGLGLVSMQERVHLVHGKFSVESALGKGTKIIAMVPVASESAGLPAKGTDSESASRPGAA